MLREITATLRTLATTRATRPVARTLTMVLAGALVAGCGIKGPLKPPPPAAAMPSAPAPERPTVPPATTDVAPAVERAPPAKP